MGKKLQGFLAMLLLPFMVVLNCPIAAIGSDVIPELAIEIDHDPVESAKAGQRIFLTTDVEDKSGVDVVRVYFKAAEAADYSFIALAPAGGSSYTGTLPAPANGVGSIEYLILVKNGNNQVVKSQTYQVTIEDSDDAAAAVAGNEKISVYTELEQMPAEITGFSDNIAIDVVESAAKLGVVVGIYSVAMAGSSTSGAVAGGTVAASSGMSTTAIVVTSVVAVAAVGGIAVAASSLSSSDDDSGSGGSSASAVGSWKETSHTGYCNEPNTAEFHETMELYADGTARFIYPHNNHSGSGTYTTSGNQITISYSGGSSSGTFDATTMNLSGSQGSCSGTETYRRL